MENDGPVIREIGRQIDKRLKIYRKALKILSVVTAVSFVALIVSTVLFW
ncbi:MAG: hypothetical protein MJ116_02825 [Lachnospiraceae bacterium]|nr:hypothetical protein [Lachnospiraceae bacterium]